MGIYDKVMGRGESAAPGAGAATDDLMMLPEIDQETYDMVWGTGTTTPGAAAPTYGSDARGPSMRQEELGGTTTGTAGSIIRAARSMVGTPYVWGGTTSSGVDCSGLVQMAYKAAGIDLPRVSYQQAEAGQQVSLKGLKPGDLVFWDNSSRNNGADHVAIYLGGGQIIEAARPGTNVRVRKLGRSEGAWGVRVLGGSNA